MAFRGWQALAGALTLVLSVSVLAPSELGLFQTMASVAALYMVLDMGMSTVLVQLSAARFNGMCWRGAVIAPVEDKLNYLSLCKSAFIWYAVGGLLFIAMLPAGLMFFQRESQAISIEWKGPWMMLVIASAMQMVLMPVLSVLEGAGRVSEVYFVRLLQVVVGTLLAWIVLLSGGKLWAVAMMPTAAVMVCVLWVLVKLRKFIAQILSAHAVSVIAWGAEVWPLQWRAAAGWLAGYALVLIHVPLLYATQGAIAAGQMGTTMTVVNTLSVLALAYPVAKVPLMVTLTSQQDWREIDKVFERVWRISFGMYLIGAFVVLLLVFELQRWSVSARLLSLEQTLLLLVGMGAYHMASVFGIFIRSHLQDPLVKISLGCAVLTVAMSYWASIYLGSLGNVCVILAVNGCLYLPLTYVVMRQLRRSKVVSS
jgi:hypothetical protein